MKWGVVSSSSKKTFYQPLHHTEMKEKCQVDMLLPDNPRYPTSHDGAIDCDYFLECVLPINPDLNRILWAELLREEDVIRPNERT